ncbi:hypothetical protein [Tautonia plasticadhaerens]|uniref:Uncharacterized protein n=1 Tax=Tautonia plasticadhaerens TaxID=2527974 RepID=A0A518H9L4_9BACT|nr:hypothetical protein [Tautonia plasticadhaerens]QDV37548.1 hypothetical protein ElP_54880 [Tautonia plasticadhaerens]
MAIAESDQGHEPTILPFTGPRNRQEVVRGDELRRRIKRAGHVLVRYRSGPNWFGYAAVTKTEALRCLDQYPAEAPHYVEGHQDGIVLGA